MYRISGGSGYAAILAHAEGALYGTELGSVTLKRIGFSEIWCEAKLSVIH